jgi:hypothetical protein
VISLAGDGDQQASGDVQARSSAAAARRRSSRRVDSERVDHCRGGAGARSLGARHELTACAGSIDRYPSGYQDSGQSRGDPCVRSGETSERGSAAGAASSAWLQVLVVSKLSRLPRTIARRGSCTARTVGDGAGRRADGATSRQTHTDGKTAARALRLLPGFFREEKKGCSLVDGVPGWEGALDGLAHPSRCDEGM